LSKLDANLRKINTSTSTITNYTELTDAYFGISSSDSYSGSSFTDDLQWNNPQDIIGYPNTFNQYADPRIAGGKYGRTEFNTILKDTPLVFIQPGIPKFLDSSVWDKITGKEDQASTLMEILKDNSIVDTLPTEIKAKVTEGNFLYDSRYYGFKPSYAKYMKFVNSLATYTAIRMGLILSSESLTSKSNLRFLSINEGGNYFTSTMVPIFCDANSTSFSEGSQNTTGESMAASMASSTSQLAREIEFLFDGQMPLDLFESNLEAYKENIGNIAGSGTNVQGLLGKVLSGATSIINGGMMLFPEIWQDSQYRKTYDLGIKLWSPYGDKVSIYNNIIFPLICLLCLSLPRQSSRTTYAAPFLVKVYSKGWFNCDLGMVESITITKGNNKSWSKDNLPLEVEVKLTVKDIYPTMMLTASRYGGLYGFNTGLLEFLDSLAGVGVGEVDYLLGLKNLANLGSEIYSNVEGYLTSLYEGKIGQFANTLSGILGAVGSAITPDAIKDEVNKIMGEITNDWFGYDESDADTSEASSGSGVYTEISSEIVDEIESVSLHTEEVVTNKKKNRDEVISKSYKRR
jgi:hypothetical protein